VDLVCASHGDCLRGPPCMSSGAHIDAHLIIGLLQSWRSHLVTISLRDAAVIRALARIGCDCAARGARAGRCRAGANARFIWVGLPNPQILRRSPSGAPRSATSRAAWAQPHRHRALTAPPPSGDADAVIQPGAVLQARYVVRTVVASGGAAEVYTADDTRLGSPSRSRAGVRRACVCGRLRARSRPARGAPPPGLAACHRSVP
jgi:hypothetical protein